MLRIFFMLFVFCVSGQNLMRSQESECTWEGAIGQCVSVYKCESAVKNIADKKFPPICSFEGRTPIICCTDCTLVDDTRLLLFNPLLGTLKKTGTSKAKDKCLDYIHTLDYACKKKLVPQNLTRVLDENKKCGYTIDVQKGGSAFAVGGKNAAREEFPHMALLGYGDTIQSASWLCGGSVISERFILTAAHCLYSRNTGPLKYIALGILKRSDPSDLWQRYNVKTAIYHPEYKPPSKYHDIALLETDTEIKFSSRVLPACLHLNNKMDMYAYATGWGAIGHNGGLADVLQSVYLNKFSDQQCSELYPEHRQLVNGYDSASQVCYGDSKNVNHIPTDTCEGDSGGPLQSQDHERCVYTILGITSYGRKCGGPGNAGMYTRVNYYVPWIESIVWP